MARPLFGGLNARISATLRANAPRYTRIVEPFGDGGTWALELAKRRPRTHQVNVVDPDLFAALTFVQNPSGADRTWLRQQDWVGSQETFDRVVAITATEGREHFYRWYYVKKFGLRMDPEQPPSFDTLNAGKNLSHSLFDLPLMKVGLRGVTITNEDPFAVMGGAGGSETFLILLPKSPEDSEAVQGRLAGLSASVFFAAKVGGAEDLAGWVSRFGQQKVSAMKVASIMMATFGAVTNYENKLTALEPAEGGGMQMAEDDEARALASVGTQNMPSTNHRGGLDGRYW